MFQRKKQATAAPDAKKRQVRTGLKSSVKTVKIPKGIFCRKNRDLLF